MMSIHWPKTATNGKAAWYNILRRFLCVVPVLITAGILMVLVFIGWGWVYARQMWRDNVDW